MILRPKKTTAGRQATFNANSTGTNLELTHISIGDVGGAIDDTRTALRGEKERVPCFGQRVNLDHIRLDAVFSSANKYWVREVGVWAGSVLVYYWSTEGEPLGFKSDIEELLMGLDLWIDPDIDQSISFAVGAPNGGICFAPHLATVLKSLADTNRLVLINNYLK